MTFRSCLKKGLLAAAAIVSAMIFFASAETVSAAESEVAADNIYIENVCVGGMNEEEIEQVIAQIMADYSDDIITINVGSQSTEVTAGELGLYQTNTGIVSKILEIGKEGNIWKRYTINKQLEDGEAVIFEVQTAVSEDSVRAIVQERCVALNQSRVDMSLAMSSEGYIYTTAKQDGIYVNEDETVLAICDYMNNEWHGGYGEVNSSVTVDSAYEDEALFAESTDLIGSGTTSFDPSENPSRTTNIEVGTAKINGTVLYPGEEFSTLEILGSFSAESGYEPAPSFEMGEIVDSYGGGLCQVSTTLYRAVLEAELEVTERYAHSRTISYVDPSMDAAVAEGLKDLKFVNNTDYPIYIQGYISNGTVVFNIYGCETRDAGRSLDFISEVLSYLEINTYYELDPDLDVGYYQVQAGYDGLTAQAVKIVYQDGVEVSREIINTSYYNSRDHIVYLGTNGATDEQIAALQEAAEAQDISQANAAVGGIVEYTGEEDETDDGTDESA